MAKWKELFFTGLINFSVGMGLGGFLRLVLDNKDIISSVILMFCGVYLFASAVFLAKNTKGE